MLTPDELLTTTRAVRRRLDMTRPVPRELLLECVDVALQAPAGSNEVVIEFLFVEDPALKAEVRDIYADTYGRYRELRDRHRTREMARVPDAQQDRVAASADFLAEHLAEVPVIALGCMRGRPSDELGLTAGGSVLPAMWSFMLAGRARGLGTAWTTLHVGRERDMAQLLGIPYDDVAQFCLTPVAFTLGDNFSPARRPSAESVVHWDRW